MKTKATFLAIALFAIYSCNSPTLKLHHALKVAGGNRSEIEKVIHHYKVVDPDKEKLEAAIFLIENMQYRVHYNSKTLKEFTFFFDSLSAIPTIPLNEPGYNEMKERLREVFLLFFKNHLDPNLQRIQSEIVPIPDLLTIQSALIIENIDLAFKTRREFPWCKNISKDDFYEFVLPYKCGNEKPEPWRKLMMEKYQWVFDSLSDPSDPIEVCNLINNELKTCFRFDVKMRRWPVEQSFSQLLKSKTGHCDAMCNMAMYAMRAMGLPVSKEVIVRQGDIGVSHSFNCLIIPDTVTYAFMGTEKNIAEFQMGRSIPKVYRETYSFPATAPFLSVKNLNSLPPEFRNAFIFDVSEFYSSSSNRQLSKFRPTDISVEIKNPVRDQSYYLCTFEREHIGAAAMGKRKKNAIVFEQVNPNIMYIPATFNAGIYTPIAPPFIADSAGKFRSLVPITDSLLTLHCYRKYQVSYAMRRYAKNLLGTLVQINQNGTWYTVDTINTLPEKYTFEGNNLPVKDPVKGFRLFFPEGTTANIAEQRLIISTTNAIDILDTIPTKTTNKVAFSTHTSLNSTSEFAFDNDIRTNYMGKSGDFIGLTFPSPLYINKYEVLIRNKFNIIEPGHKYELLYFDEGWVSCGQKVADNYFIEFDSVPPNALYILKNLSEGKEERVFTYEDEKQIFW